MRESLASLTAATVGLVASLKWYTGQDPNACLYRDVMRHISWRHMPIPLWLLLQSILCHPWCTQLFVSFWSWLLGKSKALEGVWQRKLYMERQVRHFLDHQSPQQQQQQQQVLILAAGYDTLAWRLALEYPDVNFIELDHPATGRAKRWTLERLQEKHQKREHTTPHRLPPNLYYCHAPVGKGTTLKDALQKCYPFAAAYSSRPERTVLAMPSNIPTAVVMEGLTMYLTPEQIRSILFELGNLVGCQGSVVAFDFFQLDEFHRPFNPNTKEISPLLLSFMKYKVKIFGESFQWGIDPNDLPQFLSDTPWRLIPSWKTSGGKEEIVVMMGIEYEATVEWVG